MLISDAWSLSGDADDEKKSSNEDARLAAVANNIVLSLIDEQRRRRQTVYNIDSSRWSSKSVACVFVCVDARKFLNFVHLIPKRKHFSFGGVKYAGWVIEYVIFLRGLAQHWRPRTKRNLA